MFDMPLMDFSIFKMLYILFINCYPKKKSSVILLLFMYNFKMIRNFSNLTVIVCDLSLKTNSL